MDALQLLTDLRRRGVEFRSEGDFLLYRPQEALTPQDVDLLRQHKTELLGYLRQQVRPDSVAEPWILQEWRRISIHQWQDILRESIRQGDKEREEYARWMLREVLEGWL